jgi:signal recognition particle subunit SRP54
MFEALGDRLQAVFDGLQRQGRLTEEDVNAAMRQVRLALLEADVNFKVVKEFVERVRVRAIGEEVMRNITPAQQVVKIVHDELVTTLGEAGRLNLGLQSPTVIMLVGLQGSGKTTTVGKLGAFLRKRGSRPLLVAGDVYRPAAINQLMTLGKQLDLPVYQEGNEAFPADLAARAVEHARANGHTVVLIDTAGRLNIDEMMMDEIRAIQERVKPIEVLLVADAMTGQEAVRVATDFNNAVTLTGLIMTKVDGDARGGAAISMRAVTGVPIKFLGVGEKLDALHEFHPDRLANRILGMGDVLSLVERAQQELDQDEAEKAGKRLMDGEFDLEDFLGQMQQMRRLGSITSLLEMIPGMSQLTKGVDMSNAEQDMKRLEAIIRSMTPYERRNPRMLKASRKRRVATGSGTTVEEVNQLLRQFRDMQGMMKQFRKGGRGGSRGLLSNLLGGKM